MRGTILCLTLSLVACSGGDPLGGPYGGTADPTAPNGHQSGDSSAPGDPSNPSDPQSGTDSGSKSTNNGPPGTDAGNNNNNNKSDASQQQPQPPTWTQVWTNYLQSGTKGNCKSSCHSQMGSPSAAFIWLKGRGYINGPSSLLIDSSQSCLSWYGGNMPPSGPNSWSAASTDMAAWVKAGAQNN